jgi:hypothetical protein
VPRGPFLDTLYKIDGSKVVSANLPVDSVLFVRASFTVSTNQLHILHTVLWYSQTIRLKQTLIWFNLGQVSQLAAGRRFWQAAPLRTVESR